MRTDLCDRFGIEYPIFAFTPSEHVAAAVSRAGGLGVLGCVRFNDTDELEQTLTWLDDNTDGKPYGVDVVMPMKIPTEGKSVDLKAMIPEAHMTFVEETLRKLGVPPLPEGEGREGVLGWLHSVARSHVDVALDAPTRADRQRARLAADRRDREGARARRRRWPRWPARPSTRSRTSKNGVDIIVAQGYEAGGHTGEIASMVLTPEVVDAVGPDVPVLGAGGIGSGRQVAASLALGAQGVWTGSMWLTTEEYRNLDDQQGHDRRAFLRADVRRHGAHPRLHRQAGPAAEDEVDRGLGRGGRPGAVADAAAEPARRRGAQPDQRRTTTPTSSRCPSARSSAG